MAELRNGGTSRSATASSARTAPSASSRPTSVGSSGAIRARMRLCASSTLSVVTAARAALGLVGMARSLGGARVVLHGASDPSASGYCEMKTSHLLAFLPMPSRYRIGEAAAMLGVSADTVRRMIDRGELRARRTAGGQRLIGG